MAIRRREFIALVGGAAGWPLVGHTQPTEGVRRVGVLVAGSPPDPMTGLLRRNLRDLGYAEGQNIAFEVRYAMDQSERAAELARELVGLNVDVDIIVAHCLQGLARHQRSPGQGRPRKCRVAARPGAFSWARRDDPRATR